MLTKCYLRRRQVSVEGLDDVLKELELAKTQYKHQVKLYLMKIKGDQVNFITESASKKSKSLDEIYVMVDDLKNLKVHGKVMKEV